VAKGKAITPAIKLFLGQRTIGAGPLTVTSDKKINNLQGLKNQIGHMKFTCIAEKTDQPMATGTRL
jgi:hypothetical protein